MTIHITAYTHDTMKQIEGFTELWREQTGRSLVILAETPVDGGKLLRVSREVKNPDMTVSLAEAITFVPAKAERGGK